MLVFVDIRCLQDQRYAFRGVGYHSAVLLASARDYLPRDTKIVGLICPSLGKLDASFTGLFDSIETVFAPPSAVEPSAFIQLSPMTHDPVMAARLVGRPNVFSSTVIYDFIPYDMPQNYLTNPHAEEAYSMQLAWLNSYDHFFPISAYSGKRLSEICSVTQERVSTTGVALRTEFEQMLVSDTMPTRNHEAKSLPSSYLMCVAGGDSRKNVELLLKAHASLPPHLKKLHLVIVGAYDDRQIAKLKEFYESQAGDVGRVRFMRNVSDAHLTEIYAHAVAAICCSKIEGFSLPVIEAIACKCPVLVSEIDAHLELVNTPEALFGVSNAPRLRDQIVAIATQPDMRAKLIASQTATAHRFTARRVCDRFWKPIANGMRKLSQRSTIVTRASLTQRPRIAILSPFPPDASGVADYTRRTVQALGQIADVDVYTDAENPLPTPEVKNFFPISSTPYTSGHYDNVLSVIGNSHFHTKIIDLQRRFGGPCLIHDNRLAELYNWWKGPDYLADMATQHLRRKVSTKEVSHWMSNPGDLPSMFFCEMIDSSRPLIVHSKGIQAQCLQEHGVEPKYLPFCCYRDFQVEDLTPAGKHQARAELGIAPDHFMIISLGIVGTTKGPYPCIDSIALLQKMGIQAHFYFVGDAGSLEEILRSYAVEKGVGHLIHFCGAWVSQEDYYRYIIAADMAVQLRNHFFGGLSGAMLDCISSGLRTVANDDLANALDSPETVVRISDNLGAMELAQAIQSIHASMDYHDRQPPCRETYIQEHSFDRYAIQLLQVLGVPFDPHRGTNLHWSKLRRSRPNHSSISLVRA